MDAKIRIHTKRLLIFKYRLQKIMAIQELTFTDLADKISAASHKDDADAGKYHEGIIKSYKFSKPLKEPSVLTAVNIANGLGLDDLKYLFGMDLGEFIYPDKLSVKILLINLYRSLNIEEISVKTDFVLGEVVVKAEDKYFEDFFQKVDLDEDLETNLPNLLSIVLDYRQEKTNTRIDIEQLNSKINNDEFYKQIKTTQHYDLEVYFPVLWEIILDNLPENIGIKPPLNKTAPSINDDNDNVIRDADILAKLPQQLNGSLAAIGLTDKELLSYVPIKKKTLANYLNGREGDNVNPGINTLIDLACALDVTPEYLLGLDNKHSFPILQTLESKLINLFHALKNARFKIRENHGKKVAYTKNQYVYRFFDNRSKIKSIHDAYKIISEEIDSKKLCVMNGEIVEYDDRINNDLAAEIRFKLRNNLYD